MHLSPHFETVLLPLVSLSSPQVFFWALDAATEVAACLHPVVALAQVCIMWQGSGDGDSCDSCDKINNSKYEK